METEPASWYESFFYFFHPKQVENIVRTMLPGMKERLREIYGTVFVHAFSIWSNRSEFFSQREEAKMLTVFPHSGRGAPEL